MDEGESPAEEGTETPAQEGSEQNPPIHYFGGGFVLVTQHHKNMLDHKNQHKKKHGY